MAEIAGAWGGGGNHPPGFAKLSVLSVKLCHLLANLLALWALPPPPPPPHLKNEFPPLIRSTSLNSQMQNKVLARSLEKVCIFILYFNILAHDISIEIVLELIKTGTVCMHNISSSRMLKEMRQNLSDKE